jgi:hypothetical protein
MLDVLGRSDWHKDIGLFTTIETNYVANQLIELVKQEGRQNGYSSILSDSFIERARWVNQREFWILPLHYELGVLFSFSSLSELVSTVIILPSP